MFALYLPEHLNCRCKWYLWAEYLNQIVFMQVLSFYLKFLIFFCNVAMFWIQIKKRCCFFYLISYKIFFLNLIWHITECIIINYITISIPGKFKSGNFMAKAKPISPEELRDLLKSKDYQNEVSGNNFNISQAQMEALLDRSDLFDKWEKGEMFTHYLVMLSNETIGN